MRTCLIILLLASCSGCSLLRSRYALDDPVYAEKYANGASKRDFIGKVKQAIDARHTQHLEGWLITGGAQVKTRSDETFGTIDIGRELYHSSYFTSRTSLNGLVSDESAFVGLDFGTRLQLPSRLAPFVGGGASAGIHLKDAVPLIFDAVSDAMLTTTSMDEPSRSIDGLAMLYPESGAHFWLDGRIRLTVFARYLVTTEGRDFDDWLVGGQLAIFTR